MLKPPLSPLRIDQPGQVLSKEQKTFNSRMQQIEKLRARFAAWDKSAAAYQQQYTQELVPLLEQATELEIALLHGMDRAMEYKGLTKAERRMLKEMLLDLAGMLLAECDDPAVKAVYNKHSGTDYDSEEAAQVLEMKGMLEHMFGVDLGDDGGLDSPEELARRAQAQFAQQAQRYEEQRHAEHERRARRKKTTKQQEKEAQAAADAKAMDQSIRDIYRKLASALHPDRETEPQERARKTALMQRINQAYDARNLLQLLELQLELEHIDRDHIARLSEDRLRHYNAVLKEQIGELKRELLRTEYEFRARFGIAPFVPVKPETVLRDLAADIRDARRQHRELERDLQTLSDEKRIKPWLKEMRRRIADDDFDFPLLY